MAGIVILAVGYFTLNVNCAEYEVIFEHPLYIRVNLLYSIYVPAVIHALRPSQRSSKQRLRVAYGLENILDDEPKITVELLKLYERHANK